MGRGTHQRQELAEVGTAVRNRAVNSDSISLSWLLTLQVSCGSGNGRQPTSKQGSYQLYKVFLEMNGKCWFIWDVNYLLTAPVSAPVHGLLGKRLGLDQVKCLFSKSKSIVQNLFPPKIQSFFISPFFECFQDFFFFFLIVWSRNKTHFFQFVLFSNTALALSPTLPHTPSCLELNFASVASGVG